MKKIILIFTLCISVNALAKVGLLVFVSFSMPEASLIELSEDAGKVDGALNLRGWIDGDLRKTIASVGKVMQESGWGMLTIPEYFASCNVNEVPTFVLADFDLMGNIKSFDKVSGHVPLDYALAEIAKRGQYKEEAKMLLDKLRSESA